MSDVPEWLENDPKAYPAAVALVVSGNPQPARDYLEQTQDVHNAANNGVWRRASRRLWLWAPELSMETERK